MDDVWGASRGREWGSSLARYGRSRPYSRNRDLTVTPYGVPTTVTILHEKSAPFINSPSPSLAISRHYLCSCRLQSASMSHFMLVHVQSKPSFVMERFGDRYQVNEYACSSKPQLCSRKRATLQGAARRLEMWHPTTSEGVLPKLLNGYIYPTAE